MEEEGEALWKCWDAIVAEVEMGEMWETEGKLWWDETQVVETGI